MSFGDSSLHFVIVSSALTSVTSLSICHGEDRLKPTYVSGAPIVWEWSSEPCQSCVSLPIRKDSFTLGKWYHPLSYTMLEDALPYSSVFYYSCSVDPTKMADVP